MSKAEFIEKWEAELQSVHQQWEYATNRCEQSPGWNQASLELGQRMRAISEMLGDYKDMDENYSYIQPAP